MFCALALSCAGYREQLERGRFYYEDNQFERALALWRDLESRQGDMSPTQAARYAYLRGMTDYRLGYLVEARYWLALAQAHDFRDSGALPAPWRPRLQQALGETRRGRLGLAAIERSLVQTIELGDVPAPVAPAAPRGDAGAAPSMTGPLRRGRPR